MPHAAFFELRVQINFSNVINRVTYNGTPFIRPPSGRENVVKISNEVVGLTRL